MEVVDAVGGYRSSPWRPRGGRLITAVLIARWSTPASRAFAIAWRTLSTTGSGRR